MCACVCACADYSKIPRRFSWSSRTINCTNSTRISRRYKSSSMLLDECLERLDHIHSVCSALARSLSSCGRCAFKSRARVPHCHHLGSHRVPSQSNISISPQWFPSYYPCQLPYTNERFYSDTMIHDQFNDEIQSMMVVSMLMSSSIALSFAHIHAPTHTTL